jgi:hypothetical protein
MSSQQTTDVAPNIFMHLLESICSAYLKGHCSPAVARILINGAVTMIQSHPDGRVQLSASQHERYLALLTLANSLPHT